MRAGRIIFQFFALVLALFGMVAVVIRDMRLSGVCMVVFGCAAFYTASFAPGCADAPDPTQWLPHDRRRFVTLRAVVFFIGFFASIIAYDSHGAVAVAALCLLLFVFAGGIVRHRHRRS